MFLKHRNEGHHGLREFIIKNIVSVITKSVTSWFRRFGSLQARMHHIATECVKRVPRGCQEGAKRVSRGCQEGVKRVPRGCQEGAK